MPDRLALIIANSDFDDPKLRCLKTPVRDAEALAEVLGDPEIGGFDVTLLIDEPMATVRSEISRLYARRKRSDLLLLYYSGHGIRDEHGDLYLATRNTEMGWVDDKSIEANYVRARMDKSGSQRKVVILDCCHSGAFAKGALGDSVGTRDAFAGSGYGRVILTASDAVELAWEGGAWQGADRASVFTHFLVEGLRTGAADLDHDGKIALDELYDYVYERVLTSGHAKQTPHKWAQKVEGQIIVARSLEQVESLPLDLQLAIENPLAGVRRGAVDELGHLSHSSNPELALVAREALRRLTKDDSRQVSEAAWESLANDNERPRAVNNTSADGETSSIHIEDDADHGDGQKRLITSVISSIYSWIVGTSTWHKVVIGMFLLLFLIVLSGRLVNLNQIWSAGKTPTSIPTLRPMATATSISEIVTSLTHTPAATPTSTPTLTPTVTPQPELCLGITRSASSYYLYADPDSDSTRIGFVHPEQYVRVLDQTRDHDGMLWYRIDSGDEDSSLIGWIPGDYVMEVTECPPLE